MTSSDNQRDSILHGAKIQCLVFLLTLVKLFEFKLVLGDL